MNNDSFYSIDRLVEFGMSIAVAQQMVNTMNNTMLNMHIPGSMNPIQQTPSQIFYVIIEGAQTGPLDESELSRLISAGKVTKDTLAWMPCMTAWQPVEKVPSILKLVALTPPPMPQP